MIKFIEDFNRYNRRDLQLTENHNNYIVNDIKSDESLKIPKIDNEALDENKYFKFTSTEDDYVHPYVSENDFDFTKHKGVYIKGNGEFFTSIQKSDIDGLELPYIFKIENQQYEIDEPSSLFLLFFGNYTENRCNFLTLKVRNTDKKLYKKHIETALFYLSHALENLNDYPKIESFVPAGQSFYNRTRKHEVDLNEVDWGSEYIESLSILNKGKTYKDLLAYYRFIEYFFVVNKKEEILLLIRNFNEVENPDEDTERKFFEKITDSSKKEEFALLELLSNLEHKEILSSFKELSLVKEIIGLKEEDLKINHIVKSIYSFRNEQVHAKKYARGKIQFCNSFMKDNHDAWVSMFDILASMIIKKFLYKK